MNPDDWREVSLAKLPTLEIHIERAFNRFRLKTIRDAYYSLLEAVGPLISALKYMSATPCRTCERHERARAALQAYERAIARQK